MIDHAPSPDQLLGLSATLERLDLTSTGDAAEGCRRRAAIAAGQYLAPRLESDSDTIVVAVVGPSGGGKSTIVNSLARCRISDVGSLRPTTLEPVAWTGGEVPPTFDGLRSRIAGSLVDSLRPPPEGVVVVDTPPPEVVDDSGVSIVSQILETVEAVVFVAGADRYADAGGFALLELAAERRLPTVMVLNRLPESSESHQVIAADFAAKLAARRLLPRAAADLVTTIAEGRVSSDTGALAPEVVASVAKDLEAMADPQSRPDIIATVVAGSLRRLRDDLAVIRTHILDRATRRVELLDPMRAFYREEARRLVAEVRGGKFGGTGVAELIDGLASAATRRAGRAARASAELWRELEPAIVEPVPDLFGHGIETLQVAHERLDFWLSEVDGLPRRMSKRRIGARRGRRLAEFVRIASIDPRHVPSRNVARRVAKIPGLVESARDRLAGELRGILETDSLRFVERLGPAFAGTDLTELSTGGLE
ncbi:MAG: GTPase [Acidimicrobiia bacterium]